MQRDATDAFPPNAGRGALPIMPWDVGELHRPGESGPAGAGLGLPPPRPVGTSPPLITAALQTAVEPPTDALLAQNAIQHLTVGDRRPRRGGNVRELQMAISTDERGSADNALHTVLYHKGSGGRYDTGRYDTTNRDETHVACPPSHFNKMRLASINPKFRRCPEVGPLTRLPHSPHTHYRACSALMSPPPSQLLWSLYQTKVKRAMHQGAVRSTSATLANTATQGQLLQQRALVNGNPTVAETLTTAESFTGAVPRTLKGSKQYWRLAFVQVMAMTIEYGVPEFFATFTANEMGWTDLRRACDGASFGSRPVEATRHYHHRWQAFKSKFLTGKTPIGHIEHIWYRHEEQARGSLHVHAAIWVRRRQLADGSWASGATPEAIVAMRPRLTGVSSPLAHRWRQFVTALQLHLCQEGCKWKNGKRIDRRADGQPFCKGGYPRRLWTEAQLRERDHRGELKRVQLDEQGERYEYRAELEEDVRISPYVPLWLLAWGANMNIQFMTATSFLSYISKYVPKPEPSTRVEDTAELRARDNRHERQVRYLNARKVGAPEGVFDLFEYKIKEGARIVHVSTQTPAQRRRCLHRKQPAMIDDDDDEDADDGSAPPTVDLNAPLRFYDGLLEKYEKRPRGVHSLDDGDAIDFERLTYPQFCRLYDVVSWSRMTASARNRGWCWRALSLNGERRPEVDASGTYTHASTRGSWVVRRLRPQPLWWDWMMPSKHGQAYYYQKLLLTQPFRCAEPRSFVTLASQSANFNVSGSMREECVLRGVIDAEDELATLRHDAHERHMTPEAMTRMLAQENEYRGSDEAVLNAMNNEEAAELGADDGLGDAITPEDLERFNDELRSTALPPPAPRMVGNVWYKRLANGEEKALVLNAEQLDAYEKMKTAGSKQLLVYLSGQGGTGKSTLIELLTLYWRSLGLRVLLTASSGKAARLIGGHTVHTAFKLHSTGFFLRQGLEGAQGTRQFNYLATVDIVIIDEISMLSAECFNGINTALNYVVTRATAMRGLMSFGNKSIFAVGDVRSLDPLPHSARSSPPDLRSAHVSPPDPHCGAPVVRHRIATDDRSTRVLALTRSSTSCRPSSAHSSRTRSMCRSCGVSSTSWSSRPSCGSTRMSASSPSCSRVHAEAGSI